MKKLSFIVLFVVATFIANAQLFNLGSVGIGYVYVGPKLGMNGGFNSAEGTTGAKKSINLGYQFGGAGKLGITDKLAVQGELLFTSKGWGENDDATDFKSRSNYNYISLPIIAQYAFLSFSDVDVYGSGGFYSNVMTKGETKIEYPGMTEEYHVDYSMTKRTEFGLSIGGGANIPLANNDKLNIDLRYTIGLTNVETRDNFMTGTQAKKNQTIEISAIYFVDLTRWVSFKGKSKGTKDAYDSGAPVGGAKVE